MTGKDHRQFGGGLGFLLSSRLLLCGSWVGFEASICWPGLQCEVTCSEFQCSALLGSCFLAVEVDTSLVGQFYAAASAEVPESLSIMW
jgi:hypothetical protein